MRHRVFSPRRRALAVLASVALIGLAAPARAAPGDTIAQASGPATPSTDADTELRATAERYARAWYEGNASLMAGTLHPEFMHRSVRHAAGKPDAIESISAMSLLDRTDRGLGRNTAPAARKSELSELVLHDGIASARLQLADRTEQLQLVRWNNRWRILHALVEVREASAP